MLQDAIERIFVDDIYGDIYAGIYVIRGENVVLLGEIVQTPSRAMSWWEYQDLDKEDVELPQRRVSGQEAQEAFNREIEQRKRKERSQNRVLHGMVQPLYVPWRYADWLGFLCQWLDFGGDEPILTSEACDTISNTKNFPN